MASRLIGKKEILISLAAALFLPMLVHQVVQIIHPRPVLGLSEILKELKGKDKEEERKILKEREEKYRPLYEPYLKTYFFVGIGMALFFMLLGLFFKIPTLMLGFMAGGISTFLWSFSGSWTGMNPMLKLGALILALVLLIAYGYLLHKREQV